MNISKIYRVEVKFWMTNYTEFMDKNSFLIKTNKSPMPLCIMYGRKLEETDKMIKMELQGDLIDKNNINCIKCGRKLTNKISKYLGIGPECGQHNYTSPFETEEELNNAILEIKEKLKQIKWTGWILKSGIISLTKLNGDKEEVVITENKQPEIDIRVAKSEKCNDEYSLFIKFSYNETILDIIRNQAVRYWNCNTKEWEVSIRSFKNLKNELKDYKLNIIDSNQILSDFNSNR